MNPQEWKPIKVILPPSPPKNHKETLDRLAKFLEHQEKVRVTN